MKHFAIIVLGLLIVMSAHSQLGMPNPGYNYSLTVYPNNVVMKAGDSLRFTAVSYRHNRMMFTPSNIRWYATGGAINQRGRFTAGNNSGYFTVTAVYNNIRATARIQIKGHSKRVVRIEITPTSLRLQRNEGQQFRARGYDRYGRQISFRPFWKVNGGGSITQSGYFRAGYSSGNFRVMAVDRHTGVTGAANVLITSYNHPTPPNPPYPPHPGPTPGPGNGRIVITDFDTGGNMFTPKVKIQVTVYGRHAKTVRLYKVNNYGSQSELDAANCSNGSKVYLKAKFNTFDTKYFILKLFDRHGRIIATATRNRK